MKAGTSGKLLFAALVAIGFSPAASAQTRTPTAHDETATALGCLLDHLHSGCKTGFAGSANRAALPWLWWTPEKDFELGALKSSEYAGTESVNAYITKFLDGRTADVYDVKFAHHEKTFYIARPGPDGKIRYLLIREGTPDDERTDLFVRGPG